MRFTTRIRIQTARSLAAGLLLALLASTLEAAPIPYGNFTGTDVSFNNVNEDSATNPSVPLYGAPTVSGDGMSFNPTAAFSANAPSGFNTTLTDGKLNALIVANDQDNGAIHNLGISERGDYTFAGALSQGTTDTNASVGASVILTILGVDGNPHTAVALPPQNLTFSPSGGTYDFVNDPHGPAATWTGSIFINIDALAAAAGVMGRITSIQMSSDNSLTAQSEAHTSALIEKKSGVYTVTADMNNPNTPEPSTFVLAAMGLAGLAWHIRKRRGK